MAYPCDLVPEPVFGAPVYQPYGIHFGAIAYIKKMLGESH